MIRCKNLLGTFAVTVLAGFLAYSHSWGSTIPLTKLAERIKSAKRSDTVVKVSAKGDKINAKGEQVVKIMLNIEKGWHSYANPVMNKELTPVQTTVTITGKKKLEKVVIDYPEGKLVMDSVAGNYWTYENKVVITAKVSRAKGDDAPLDVKVKVQACNENSCLPPATVKLKVK